MGISRYYRWTVLTLLVVGCAAASAQPKPSVVIQIPHGATCYLKQDEVLERQMLACVCEGECWEQSR